MRSNDAVAIAGIAVTFIVSVANLIYSLRTNKRTIFVNTVTASRLKWIDSLRDKVSEFIAVTTCISGHPTSPEKLAELLLRRDTLLHQIALHLNPSDAHDQKINEIANHAQEMTNLRENNNILAAILVQLREATGSYLKKEWNRVKGESEGKQC